MTTTTVANSTTRRMTTPRVMAMTGTPDEDVVMVSPVTAEGKSLQTQYLAYQYNKYTLETLVVVSATHQY